jgi:hypothetical protein
MPMRALTSAGESIAAARVAANAASSTTSDDLVGTLALGCSLAAMTIRRIALSAGLILLAVAAFVIVIALFWPRGWDGFLP